MTVCKMLLMLDSVSGPKPVCLQQVTVHLDLESLKLGRCSRCLQDVKRKGVPGGDSSVGECPSGFENSNAFERTLSVNKGQPKSKWEFLIPFVSLQTGRGPDLSISKAHVRCRFRSRKAASSHGRAESYTRRPDIGMVLRLPTLFFPSHIPHVHLQFALIK